ncbi:MAG TPA: RraA family protein, partial [Bryobacteraceae bacterium]|nr:RraA family protein [Bryobacteraceae bacterium]
MTRRLLTLAAGLSLLCGLALWLPAQQPSGDPVLDGFRLIEASSVADAIEQLYGQKAYMSHKMRPLFP